MPLRTDFTKLMSARFLFTFGTQIQSVVLGWQMYTLTKNPLYLGLIGLVEAIPALGLALVAGYMVETRGYGERSLPMEIEYLVEETMEMVGAAYFLTAMLRYIELGGQPLQLTVTMPDSTEPRHGDP